MRRMILLLIPVAVIGLSLVLQESLGLALMVAVPLAIGIACGSTMRVAAVLKAIGALFFLGGALMSLIFWNLVGFYCAFIAAVAGGVPLLVGVAIGHFASPDRAWQKQLLLLVALPAGTHLVEQHLEHDFAVETVATEALLPMDAPSAWAAMRFYEDAGGERPLALRMGLKRPIRTVGPTREVGGRTLCLYEGGHILKQTTAVERHRLLAFDVLEQVGVEDKSIRLLDGSFRFEPLGEATRVTMTTRYRPLLAPRWYWRPFEVWTARSLHRHIAAQMARQPDYRPPPTPVPPRLLALLYDRP